MASFTNRVIEKDIRIDERAFFEFAEHAKGPHTGWLREIGRAHAKGEIQRFSFKMFVGTKLVGYESNPELHVLLKAIEAHMQRSRTRAFGRVQLFGQADELPRTILLDYFNGLLSLTYPVWHQVDLASVALDVRSPRKRAQDVELGIAYVFRTVQTKRKSESAPTVKDEVIAAGVAGSTLYVGYPDWVKKKGRAEAYHSRSEALAALARWRGQQVEAGYALLERSPLAELRRSAKGKFPGWSFG